MNTMKKVSNQEGHHSHQCPNCSRITGGIGNSLCPPCANLNWPFVVADAKLNRRLVKTSSGIINGGDPLPTKKES